MKASRNYREELARGLRRPKEAARYLNAALVDGDRKVFLLAMRDVALACGGMTRLARQTKLNRENLYRMLSENGNPGLVGLGGLLDAMGLRLAIQAK